MENYGAMSDFEINQMVGETFGWNAKFIHPDDSVTFRCDLGRMRGVKNYCNSWADAGPIIEKNRIAIMRAGEINWASHSTGVDNYAVNKNPLRSAMETFLMMQESK